MWCLLCTGFLSGCSTARTPPASGVDEALRVLSAQDTIDALTADKLVVTIEARVEYWPSGEAPSHQAVLPIVGAAVRDLVAKQAGMDFFTTNSRVRFDEALQWEVRRELDAVGFTLGRVRVLDATPEAKLAEAIRTLQEREQEAVRLQAEAEIEAARAASEETPVTDP